MSKLLHLSATLILCTALLCGCGGGGGGDDSSSSNACDLLNLKITNGDECNPSQSPVVLVAIINDDSQLIAICSGTAITATEVLTAGHCFDLAETAGAAILIGDDTYGVNRIRVHPSYDKNLSVSKHDLAVLQVTSAMPVDPVPLVISRKTAIGDQLGVFGYGDHGDGHGGIDLGTQALSAAFMDISSFEDDFLIASFDDTGSSVCTGDSGGPATYALNGVSGVVGVSNAVTDERCLAGTLALFTDVQLPANLDFIVNNAPGVELR
jgi:secreted trypsin-like serine protease